MNNAHCRCMPHNLAVPPLTPPNLLTCCPIEIESLGVEDRGSSYSNNFSTKPLCPHIGMFFGHQYKAVCTARPPAETTPRNSKAPVHAVVIPRLVGVLRQVRPLKLHVPLHLNHRNHTTTQNEGESSQDEDVWWGDAEAVEQQVAPHQSQCSPEGSPAARGTRLGTTKLLHGISSTSPLKPPPPASPRRETSRRQTRSPRRLSARNLVR